MCKCQRAVRTGVNHDRFYDQPLKGEISVRRRLIKECGNQTTLFQLCVVSSFEPFVNGLCTVPIRLIVRLEL